MIFNVSNFDFSGKSVEVYLDGKRIRKVFYADSHLGIVRYMDNPPVMNSDGTDVVRHIAMGDVQVVVIPSASTLTISPIETPVFAGDKVKELTDKIK